MASSGKTTCCLMLIFLLIHQTVSFSVEELCARRCLYGRGGVLCNCNAMHFTGKRSESESSPHIFGPNRNSMDMNGQDDDEETSEMFSSVYGTVNPIGNHAYHHTFGKGSDEVLENSWNQRHLGNVLATLDRNADSDVLSSKHERPHKSHGSLPMLILTRNVGHDDNDENDFTGSTREEVASRIKMIMGGVPFPDTPGHISRDEIDPHDLSNKQGRISTKRAKSRDHLSRLHRVLDQALQGR